MNRVFQDDVTLETGNCLQACIASLLNLDLKQVPSFKVLNPNKPVIPMLDFMSLRGYSVVQVRNLHDATKDTLCLAAVPSERYKVRGSEGWHVVVGRIDRRGRVVLLHDPNPDSTLKKGKKLDWIRLYFIFSGSRRIN